MKYNNMVYSLDNEEDVKIKLIIPYLEELGFDRNELSFETNFSFKFGKNTLTVNGVSPDNSPSARLDILVKLSDKNICVFEAKRLGTKISEEDIRQAISYGSLVKPTVPFCIVANGKESIMVDTLDCSVINEQRLEQYKINGYVATLPESSYLERIKHFLGYSVENLTLFCTEQVSLYTKTLSGSKNVTSAKYIEDIYVPSPLVNEVFEKFCSQIQSRAFALIAQSGMGKTCWACHTAHSLLTQNIPTLFYRAVDVRNGILEKIIDDLSWELSPAFNVHQGIKRFTEVFKEKYVYIIVDGLDEIPRTDAIDITQNFLRAARNLNIKVVFTCKSAVWSDLLIDDNIPTELSDKVSNDFAYIYELETDQFIEMIDKYRQFYGVKVTFQDSVWQDCKRNPYILRIMFEVAASEQTVFLTYTSRTFFQKYYDLLINRFSPQEREQVKQILEKLCLLMYTENRDYIDVSILRTALGMNFSDSLPARLFELNILEIVSDANRGLDEIGFYFQKIRDYIGAFKSLHWQSLDCQQFSAEIENKTHFVGVKLSVLELYYSLCQDDHKRIIDNPLHTAACQYVDAYETILNNDFPSLKERFDPHTRGHIGLVGYLEIARNQMIMYGFRAIDIKKTKCYLYPVVIDNLLKMITLPIFMALKLI